MNEHTPFKDGEFFIANVKIKVSNLNKVKIYLPSMKLSEVQKILGFTKEQMAIAIANGKKNDWFNICKYGNDIYLVVNPAYAWFIVEESFEE